MSCDSHLTLVIPYRMDKMMESVGLYSSVHVGKIPVSVAEPIKVGQAKSVKVITRVFSQESVLYSLCLCTWIVFKKCSCTS